MVFSSLEFILLFLPFCIFIFYALHKTGYGRLVMPFLFLASLFYYGYWKPENIWIIIASIAMNFTLAKHIAKNSFSRKFLFIIGIVFNLSLLAYYKYTDFALSTLSALTNTDLPLTGIVLPIGISFFTFQQIAYLSDIYTKKYNAGGESFISYCCFVCFFPQLIAGPIVHHSEMMPQFKNAKNQQINWENIYSGLFLLSIGLAKKLIIADSLAPIVTYGFDTAPALGFLDACFTSIAYTLQLYFDFSGYTDMAIGCALFFNIHLPKNFDSPYKACDIQDFWRRWHMTLSRWLRDYLYIPLGGNRLGGTRTCINIFLTFLLGGLWHGAAWTFVLWGAMHGAALIIHRLWSQKYAKKLPTILGWSITFCFVNMAWIIFRALTFEDVWKFIQGFLGVNGLGFAYAFKYGTTYHSVFTNFSSACLFVLFALGIALFAKNSSYMLEYKYKKYTPILIVILLFLSLSCIYTEDATATFIYFNF